MAGFAPGANMIGWNTDWRDKVDVGRPERRQLQYPGGCEYLVQGLLTVLAMSEQN